MLRKDQLEPANQLSLVTTYGLTPVLAADRVRGADQRRRPAVATCIPGVDEVDLALYLNALTFLVAAVVIWNLPSISGRRAAGRGRVAGVLPRLAASTASPSPATRRWCAA